MPIRYRCHQNSLIELFPLIPQRVSESITQTKHRRTEVPHQMPGWVMRQGGYSGRYQGVPADRLCEQIQYLQFREVCGDE